jgi:hypothetical protein
MQQRWWRGRRYLRCRVRWSVDVAIATGNTIKVGGIDDPQTATLRLLMDPNFTHALADAQLAGRNVTAARSPITRSLQWTYAGPGKANTRTGEPSRLSFAFRRAAPC